MEAFSTNYRRTQLSAQGFLDGLREEKGGIPVVVRPRAEDFLNNWESRGREMTEVRDVMSLDRRASVSSLLRRYNDGVRYYPKAVGVMVCAPRALRRIAMRSCDGDVFGVRVTC